MRLRVSILLLASTAFAACGGDSFETAAGGNAGGASSGAAGSSSGAAGQAGTSAAGTAGSGAGEAGSAHAGGGQAGAGQAGAGQGGSGPAGMAGGGAAGAPGGSSGAAGLGGAGQAGQAGTAGSAGSGGKAQPPTTVFVSGTTGDDLADGFSPATAKKTIPAGVAAAAAAGLSEVRVNRGKYTLAATLEVPGTLSLSGGWSADFASGWGGYTPANLCDGNVDGSQLTTISGPGVDTLIHLGQGTQGKLSGLDLVAERVGVSFEGSAGTLTDSRVTVVGVPAPTAPTSAVFVAGGTAKVLKSCVMGGPGASAKAGQVASIGVSFVGGATGELGQSRVQGGSGEGAGFGPGSVAVAVVDASPKVVGNDLRGGSGKTSALETVGSIGIFALSSNAGAGPSAPILQKNVVNGGSGKAATNAAFGSVAALVGCVGEVNSVCKGMTLTGAEKAVSGNTLDGGTGQNGGQGAPSSAGIVLFGDLAASFQIDVTENRIYGGLTQTLASGKIGVLANRARGVLARNTILGGDGPMTEPSGVSVDGVADFLIESNMIYGAAGVTTKTNGVVITSSTNVVVRHNTVVTGGGTMAGRGIFLRESGTESKGIRIDNNLLLGGDGPGHAGVELGVCPAGAVDSFRGNAFANLGDRAVTTVYGTGTCLSGMAFSASAFVGGMSTYCSTQSTCGPLGGSLTDDVDVRPTCIGGDVLCRPMPACSSLATCGPALFASFSLDGGKMTLLDQQGYQLRPTLACNLVNAEMLPNSGPDRFGTVRTDPPARGAHEQDTCTKN